MKNIILLVGFLFYAVLIMSQNKTAVFNTDSVTITSKVEFFTYNGPYGTEDNISKPAINFIVTVKNNGSKPIPDLAVTNRSEYLNFYVNGKIENPMSMYNGAQISGDHMLEKGQSDSYTWWVFTEDAYADVFTVQWEYCGKLSEVRKVEVRK